MEQIYKTMSELNLVKNQYEFSKNWLGQCKTYYGVVKHNKQKIGLSALMKLQKKLSQTEVTEKDTNKHKKEGITKLKEMVLREIESGL